MRHAVKIRCLTTVLIVALAVIGVCGTAFAGKLQLPQGTEIKVRFAADAKINSGASVPGDVVAIELAEPITLAGQVIVDKGATGTAVVDEVKPSGRGGKPGYITVKFAELIPSGAFKVVGDGKIMLSGVAEGEGKGKKTLSYLFIFGLFIKGGQGEIVAGQTYTATIAENVLLEN